MIYLLRYHNTKALLSLRFSLISSSLYRLITSLLSTNFPSSQPLLLSLCRALILFFLFFPSFPHIFFFFFCCSQVFYLQDPRSHNRSDFFFSYPRSLFQEFAYLCITKRIEAFFFFYRRRITPLFFRGELKDRCADFFEVNRRRFSLLLYLHKNKTDVDVRAVYVICIWKIPQKLKKKNKKKLMYYGFWENGLFNIFF